LVGVAVAEAMGLAVAEVAHVTTSNSRAFYGLD
jgi:Tat protein secretion system quality control protein TatD with DNase activity